MPTLEWDFFQYANLADGVKPHPYEGNGYWKIEHLGKMQKDE